ncbi:cytochrome d ubiquinol oxidase subunit II [Enterobacteriaceae endosymbiont of Plateumaris consimilis]|uniref:cytochrome d ubiquinol oxidase subunit II n=1 Tax=Enterobacteriaceae endosymbiont of Plateumaris consimilis TaxID=2675794 RepID=UPI00144A0554|nr:cytochrome d ubiquinol oxidase subunit II [Enterobacteriaceae endosymbiont of Plateumaris consimilis]QJC28619.1 cytochrome d ubiquinol oxidase subunit II [Enterobacteriaceae endosymbiont of Plateumaris consimilis]
MLDYNILCIIWWFLIGILVIGFLITDGLDMGVGILLFIIGKNNLERRMMINSIAPHWDGNQVWLITVGGALFAAWPIVYATLFSSFYIVMIIMLLSLFLRPVGFEYRSKIKNNKWQNICDILISIGSIVPPFIIGIAMGNLLKGIPFYIDKYFYIHSTLNFLNLFNIFSIIISITSLTMFINQASTYLQLRINDKYISYKAYIITQISSIILIIFFILSFINTIFYIKGYKFNLLIINNIMDLNKKEILHTYGSWFSNFQTHHYLLIIPLICLILPIGTIIYSQFKNKIMTFICSSLTITFVVFTIGITMFPFIVPSSIIPSHSLTMWNAASSKLTLSVMLYAAIIFVPIVLSYTIWCYKKMFFLITKEEIKKNTNNYY